jgi:hypothetical protein
MKLFAPLLVAAPLALAACGSSTAQVSDPLSYVKQAAKKTAQTSHHVTTAGAFAGMTSAGSGDFSSNARAGSFADTEAVYGHTTKFTDVVSGSSVYEILKGLPAGKKWFMVDFSKLPRGTCVEPAMVNARSQAHALQTLGAAGTVIKVGTQTIDGVTTTHYRVTRVDLSKLPASERSEFMIDPKYGPVDVWIGSDGYVYREKLLITDRGGSGQPLTETVNFSKFGQAVHADVPTARETEDDTKAGC